MSDRGLTMSCTSSFLGTTASLSFGGFGSGGTEFSPPSAWNFAMRVLLYDQPSENLFYFILYHLKIFDNGCRGGGGLLNLGKPAGKLREEAYGHNDFRIGIAAVYRGHSLRWGEGRSWDRLSTNYHNRIAIQPFPFAINSTWRLWR